MSGPLQVVARGSGDASDVALVSAELAKLPAALQSLLHDQELVVFACRDAVTDACPELLDDHPRGWPPGRTWALVPGAYVPARKAVVIATVPVPEDASRRHVPPKGWMHNAFNLVVHETLHADDYLADRLRCHNPDFKAARSADYDALHDYEKQDGDAGLEETYAESGSRFFGGDTTLAEAWPNLDRFWAERSFPVPPGRRIRRRRRSAVGLARQTADGAYELDLRAENGQGAIGHALFRLEAGTQGYDEMDRRRRRAPEPAGPEGWSLVDAF